MNGETILIVEDEQPIAHVLTTILSANGYHTLQASTGTLARSIINSHCPRLILLDLGLPDMDGLELLRWLREWSGVPVLIVSAREEENQKVEALDLGADDYISKPFGILELLSRIRAVARRTVESSKSAAVNGAHSYDYGNVHVDEDGHVVTVDGEEVLLTRKEFRLLCDLLRNQGRVLTRDQIMEQVWGFDYGGATRTVDIHINTLRKKIHDDGTMIQTVRGIGYKIDKEAKE